MVHRWADNDQQDAQTTNAEQERYYWNLSRQQARERKMAGARARIVSITCGVMLLPFALFLAFVVFAAIINALHI